MNLVPKRNRGDLSPRGENSLEWLRREFNSLFDRMWGGFFPPSEEMANQRFWDFDVQENDKEVVVRAEMPGFDEKELDLQVADNVLTIKGEHQEKQDGHESTRRFQRSMTLPPGADPEKIQASYHNGVLELHIPRPEEARPKRIPIQGAPSGQQTAEPTKEAEQAKK